MRISEFEKEVIITSIRKNFNEVKKLVFSLPALMTASGGGDIDVLLLTFR